MIKLMQEPFPHLVITDVYSEQELKLIWQELDFLTSASKLLPANMQGSMDGNHLSIVLDAIYTQRNISNILTLNRKIYSKEIREAFSSLSPLLGHINLVNKDLTKIKYYENFNNYQKHQDTARFTAVTYFFKEPKLFSGGDLYFNDYDYLIPIENNMAVIFVGSIFHTVTPVDLKQLGHITGNGKYTMTQFMEVTNDPSAKNI